MPDNKSSLEEAIANLIKAITLDQKSIADMVSNESKKLQEIAQKYENNEIKFEDALNSSDNIDKMLNSVIMKEWLFINKLQGIKDIAEELKSFYTKEKGQQAPSNTYVPDDVSD